MDVEAPLLLDMLPLGLVSASDAHRPPEAEEDGEERRQRAGDVIPSTLSVRFPRQTPAGARLDLSDSLSNPCHCQSVSVLLNLRMPKPGQQARIPVPLENLMNGSPCLSLSGPREPKTASAQGSAGRARAEITDASFD